MINLAPIRYADVLSQKGGPIARVEYEHGVLMGWPCVHAVAYLRDGLVSSRFRSKAKTTQPDGAGSHRSIQTACHMAVSEALERWAVYFCRARARDDLYGMGYDGSSNGFAAFPGLFRRQARKAAFQESVERHCLINWWEGYLEHRCLKDPQPGVRSIEIENAFSSHSVVILWTTHAGGHAFAFGAAENLNKATWRALVELERTKLLLNHLDTVSHQPTEDLFERRIEYFSTCEGMRRFLARLDSGSTGRAKPLNMIFDGRVCGPWDRYASVWRTVIEAPNRDYLSDSADYFFW